MDRFTLKNTMCIIKYYINGLTFLQKPQKCEFATLLYFIQESSNLGPQAGHTAQGFL
jgi:hypothetical protein